MMISIIVPVYNVEKYIRKCLDSILAQTYEDYELLIIDDGSTDGSGSILDDYVKKDSRIRVFHRQNEGAAGARNFGLDQANGEYICFIDSDDWVESSYLEELYELIEANQADVAMCRYVNNHGDDHIEQITNDSISIQKGIDAIDNLYNERCLEYIVVWNKIYKRKLFDNIRFIKGMICEDEVICAETLIQAEKVARTERVLYNYRINNESSVMSESYSLKRLDIIRALELRMDLFNRENLRNYYEKDGFKYLYKILLNIIELKKLPNDNYILINELKRKYWKKYKEALSFEWSKKRKIGMFFFGLFPRAYLLRYKKN